MKIKTLYSTNPKCARTRLYLSDTGERDAISVCSHLGDTEAENLYIYREGKRVLAGRIEKRRETTTEFYYPFFTGKMKIVEKYHPEGKLVSTTTYDEHWNETGFQWAE